MELRKNTVYEHSEHGEILIRSVHEIYTSYDTVDGADSPDRIVVEFAIDWDDYGMLHPKPVTEPIEEITRKIGQAKRVVEFPDNGTAG